MSLNTIAFMFFSHMYANQSILQKVRNRKLQKKDIYNNRLWNVFN